MRDNRSSINDMMYIVANVMECRADWFDTYALHYARADPELAAAFRQDVEDTKIAVNVIRKLGGCWI